MDDSFGRWLTLYFTNHLAKINSFLEPRLTSWNITNRLAFTCKVFEQTLWIVVSEWASPRNVVVIVGNVFALFAKFKR